MLYVSTRNTTDSYTAYRVLHEDYAPDGGVFAPYRLPIFSSEEHKSFCEKTFGERVAKNMPIQGTAADIIKIAMNKVNDRLIKENLDAKLIMQVHDELIIEAKEEIAPKVAEILKQEMENAVDFKVPMLVDVKYAKTWFETK